MFTTSTHSNIRRAVCLGLGVGIFLTGLFSVKVLKLELAKEVRCRDLLTAGCVAGIGFTVATGSSRRRSTSTGAARGSSRWPRRTRRAARRRRPHTSIQ